ncbi:MAG: alpha/beta hydrolase [Paracoccaceae bacterium]|nr:alpha/beta hydrolase [Paracoccaceae bacterium]
MATGSTRSTRPRLTICPKLAALELLLIGTLTSTFVAVTERRAKRREVQALRDFPPTGRLLTVNGARVHAHTEGRGPDLVLLHGASGNTREFTFHLVDRLKGDYRVTAFDRPGLGWSDPIPDGHDPRAQARHLQAAAAELGLTRPLVLGQSYGGAVALGWALTAPDDTAGLVIVSGASNPWPGTLGRWYQLTSSRIGRSAVIPLVTAFASHGQIVTTITEIFAPEAVPRGYTDYVGVPLTIRRLVLAENAVQVNGLLPHVREMAPLYPGLDLPVEIVHGTADTIVPMDIHSEPLSRQIPGAVLTRLEGAGHMPHHTRPDDVIAAIHRAAARAGLR